MKHIYIYIHILRHLKNQNLVYLIPKSIYIYIFMYEIVKCANMHCCKMSLKQCCGYPFGTALWPAYGWLTCASRVSRP